MLWERGKHSCSLDIGQLRASFLQHTETAEQ